jgi:hypothetical protein
MIISCSIDVHSSSNVATAWILPKCCYIQLTLTMAPIAAADAAAADAASLAS